MNDFLFEKCQVYVLANGQIWSKCIHIYCFICQSNCNLVQSIMWFASIFHPLQPVRCHKNFLDKQSNFLKDAGGVCCPGPEQIYLGLVDLNGKSPSFSPQLEQDPQPMIATRCYITICFMFRPAITEPGRGKSSNINLAALRCYEIGMQRAAKQVNTWSIPSWAMCCSNLLKKVEW